MHFHSCRLFYSTDDDEGGDAFDADVDVDGSINFAGDVAKSVAFAPDTEDAGNLNNEGDDDDDDDNDVIFGGCDVVSLALSLLDCGRCD